MNKSVKILSLAIVAISASNIATASDAIGPGDKDARWIIGGSVVTATNIYLGEDTEHTVFPNIVFNGERLFIKDGAVNFAISEWGQVSAGLTASYDANFLSFESEYRDNAALAGLEEREATIEGGFYVNHTTDMGRLKFSFLSDLGSKHDGYTSTLKYTFDLHAGDWSINPMVGASWISSDKVNHYFGVSEAESTDMRLAYEGDSTYNFFAGVRGRYEINDHFDLSIQTGVMKFGSEITDSSIVEEDTSYYGSLTLGYSF